jgi:hypothetical protein
MAGLKSVVWRTQPTNFMIEEFSWGEGSVIRKYKNIWCCFSSFFFLFFEKNKTFVSFILNS